EAIGYEVWLDEKNLQAGDALERGIFNGFKESCAAVFFITDNFKDEKYLKAEIDYAMSKPARKKITSRSLRLPLNRVQGMWPFLSCCGVLCGRNLPPSWMLLLRL
ncbi:MAG: toll/interleukin-1 receptor domain-containing protein, partial [Cytophagales bacterium]